MPAADEAAGSGRFAAARMVAQRRRDGRVATLHREDGSPHRRWQP